MAGFHAHDDDFLYESQNDPDFAKKWDSQGDTAKRRPPKISRLRTIIAEIERRLQTAREREKQ
jgi:hypothetical protein